MHNTNVILYRTLEQRAEVEFYVRLTDLTQICRISRKISGLFLVSCFQVEVANVVMLKNQNITSFTNTDAHIQVSLGTKL